MRSHEERDTIREVVEEEGNNENKKSIKEGS